MRVHSKMRRRIENPRILLLDTPLEYKKGESQTNVEITDEEDWNTLLKMEEEYVENMCMETKTAGQECLNKQPLTYVPEVPIQNSNIFENCLPAILAPALLFSEGTLAYGRILGKGSSSSLAA